MNFRHQANNVSGVTMVATAANKLPAEAFCLTGQPAPLIIIQPQPSAADPFSKGAIFFAQVIDGNPVADD